MGEHRTGRHLMLRTGEQDITNNNRSSHLLVDIANTVNETPTGVSINRSSLISPKPKSKSLISSSKKTTSRFIQFYKDRLPPPGRPCIEKWSISIEKQIYFAEWIFDACYRIPENAYLTVFKVLMGIICTISLILEYGRGEDLMKVYILINIVFCVSYLLSIIILNIARYVATKSNNLESNFNLISTAWYYLNAFGLVLSCDSILVMIILVRCWNINYYIYFTCIGLTLVTDALGLFVLSFPVMIGIMFECAIYYLIQMTCGRCLRKGIIPIPGVNCAPNLYLKQHEQEVAETNANNHCPICLSAFKEGQYVVFMPCGEAHIFHRHCITTWMKNHGECPTCRAEFLYQDDISIVSEPAMTIVNSEEIFSPQVVSHMEAQVTTKSLNIRSHDTPAQRNSFSQHLHSIEEANTLELASAPRVLHTESSIPHQIIYGQIFRSLLTPSQCNIYIYIYNI